MKMKGLVMRFVLFLLTGIFLFRSAATANENEYIKPRLAVIEFETRSLDAATVQTVTDLTQSLMENSGLYTLVERSQVNKVFEEQVFQYSGSVDEQTAIKIGKMLGASKLMLGSINAIGKQLVVIGRIVDVETGKIEATGSRISSSKLNLNDSMLSLVKILTKKDLAERKRHQD